MSKVYKIEEWDSKRHYWRVWELVDGKSKLLASNGRGGWKIARWQPHFREGEGETRDITEEEVAMILFQCKDRR